MGFETIIGFIIIFFVFLLLLSKVNVEVVKQEPQKGKTHYTAPEITGSVYVIRNVLFPEYVKIGMTTRTAEERVRNFNTAVPFDFDILIDILIVKILMKLSKIYIEKGIYDKYRINPNREFFEISIEDLKIKLDEKYKLNYVEC